MSDKKSVKIKASLGVGEVVSHLEKIVTGLKKGTLCIQHGEDYATLQPKDNLFFEMKADEKKGGGKVSIEFGYKSEIKKPEPQKSGLKISSKEPQPVKKEVAA